MRNHSCVRALTLLFGEKRRDFVGALPDRGIVLVLVCAILDCRDFLCCWFATLRVARFSHQG